MRKHNGPSENFLPGGLTVIHEDRDLIVVDKPAGLLPLARIEGNHAPLISFSPNTCAKVMQILSSVQYSTFELRVAN
jgi:23S rRNA-/tRNA-specific pseudouridylate synthase